MEFPALLFIAFGAGLVSSAILWAVRIELRIKLCERRTDLLDVAIGSGLAAHLRSQASPPSLGPGDGRESARDMNRRLLKEWLAQYRDSP